MLKADARHAFTETTALDKLLLQPAQLMVDEIVGLVNETDCDVGYDFGSPRFHEFTVVFVGLGSFAAEPANVLRLFRGLVPHGQIASAEVVFVVVEQFLQAGAGHIRQFDLRFFSGQTGLAAFQDVLFA